MGQSLAKSWNLHFHFLIIDDASTNFLSIKLDILYVFLLTAYSTAWHTAGYVPKRMAIGITSALF